MFRPHLPQAGACPAGQAAFAERHKHGTPAQEQKVHAAQERHHHPARQSPSQRIPSAAILGQARHAPVLTRMAAQVLTVVLGQDLPDEAASAMQQQFALVVAVIGLAAFALVLALIEQLVLSVLDDNVRRGSRVYERGHVRPRR